MGLTDRVNARAVGTGAATGAGAYVLGYLIVYLTQRGSIEDRFTAFNVVTDVLGGDPIPVWQAIGWLFYNAHFVETRIPSIGGPSMRDFIRSADDGSLTLLYLVPPVLLVGAGYATIALSGESESDAQVAGDPPDAEVGDGLLGALVVVGYLPLAIVGIFLFSYAVGDGAIAPDAITGVLLAGIVYPAVFGAIGSVLGDRL
jgi:hypothetical protein